MIILGKKVVSRLETLQYAAKKFAWPDNWVIGISSYYAFWAWILARLTGKKCLYYCIDYYTYRVRKDFLDGISIWLAAKLDRFLCKHVDYVWDISVRINYGRMELEKKILYRNMTKQYIGEPLNKKEYGTPSRIVPLTYPPSYFRDSVVYYKVPVFVGLVPYGKDLWPINTVWLGKGNMRLEDMLDQLSNCGIGISIWDRDGNNYYGDPGKTKLYSACGLPVIMTNNTPYAEVIDRLKAGIIVEYTKKSIDDAVKKIFENYDFYKSNVYRTRDFINADKLLRDFKILVS